MINNSKKDHRYTKCSYKNCYSCKNFVDETIYIACNATGGKYKIRRDTSCNSKNVIYITCCIKCMKQGVELTTPSKPHLSDNV